MKIIGFMSCYNEQLYIEQAIRSTIDHIDQLIIIEGAWKETYETCGHKRSTDKTIEIIEKLKEEFPKISVYYENADNQLKQRSLYFKYAPKEPHWMFLQDADEIYDRSDIENIIKFINSEPDKNVYNIDSLTFVNDSKHYVPIDFPRLFRIQEGFYEFVEPNKLLNNKKEINKTSQKIPNIKFFHYSYVKNDKRFKEKVKERTRIHGQFIWKLENNKITRNNLKTQVYEGKHPINIESVVRYTEQVEVKENQQETIIFSEFSGIGNMVLSTPALKAIRLLKPDCKLYVLTWPRASRVLDGLEFIDMVINTDPLLFINSLQRKIDHYLLSPLGGFYIPELSKYCKSVYTNPVTPPWAKSEAEYKVDLVRKIGYKGQVPDQEFTIFDYNYENANNFINENKLKKFICINAGYLKTDNWPKKHWQNNNYIDLIDRIWSNYNIPCVLIGSKEDKKDADEICKSLYDKAINACGFSNDLKDTAALISKASLVIGNDGGLAHVASAIKIPTITIFLYTNILKNKPLGKLSNIVANQCQYRIMCQHQNCIEEKCRPNGCLSVSVDQVFNKVLNII